jgi:putative Ca2+/H+ antiporter (TMEM165/GDT1 family)
MYIEILRVHSILRWVLLLCLIITLVKYLVGWQGNRQWKKSDNILSIVFTSLMDIQLLLGLALYFFLSPITQFALSDFGAAMKDPELRFYAVEHFSMMLIAVVLVHIGRAKSKKIKIDRNKFKTAFIFFFIALIVMLVVIPWSRL